MYLPFFFSLFFQQRNISPFRFEHRGKILNEWGVSSYSAPRFPVLNFPSNQEARLMCVWRIIMFSTMEFRKEDFSEGCMQRNVPIENAFSFFLLEKRLKFSISGEIKLRGRIFCFEFEDVFILRRQRRN